MKFKHYLETIAGVGVYPIISLVLFVAFFLIVTLWVIKTDNSMINKLKNIPFDNNPNDNA